MGLFQTLLDYKLFAASVINKSRYRYHPEDEEFLKTVEDTGLRRIIVLPAAMTLFRAQLGNEGEPGNILEGTKQNFSPYLPDRMKPKAKSAKEGRVNPKGIPCLYLADTPGTAISEVRPWIGAFVSIGYFVTTRDLRLMDCTTPRQAESLADLLLDRQPELEEKIWSQISYAFSEPVTESDVKAAYAPTQVLAEVFRSMGCDGIKYQSLQDNGGNSFALFRLDDAELFVCAICKTEQILHNFSDEFEHYRVERSGGQVRVIRQSEDEAAKNDEVRKSRG